MTEPWCEELRRISASVENAEASLRALHEWLWHTAVAADALPRQLPQDAAALLHILQVELSRIREAERHAFERYAAGPAAKWAQGKMLTREEYYVVAAAAAPFVTAKQLGLSDVDDYDLFCLLCYEDDERLAYINPFEKPRDRRSGRVGMRIGRPPEELTATALRPEQHEFFAEHLPDVYARFRR